MRNSKTIDFAAQSAAMSELAKKLYEQILALGPKVRDDFDDKGQPKSRPGITITGWDFKSENQTRIHVANPLPLYDLLSVEKIIRPHERGHKTSQQSENSELFRFRGGLRFTWNSVWYGIGVSGLKPDEDVLVGINQISLVTGVNLQGVLLSYSKGELPASFSTGGNYLHELLAELTIEQMQL